MNDQSQMMNQHQVKSHHYSNFGLKKQSRFKKPMKNQNQSQMMMSYYYSQMLNQLQNQPQMVNQKPPQMTAREAQMVNQLSQQPLMGSQAPNPMIVQPQSKMMMGQNNYGQWPQQPPVNMPPPSMNAMKFPNYMNQMYGGIAKQGRGNWKGKKPMDKRKDIRRKDKVMPGGVGGVGASGAVITGPGGGGGGGGVYQPPTLYELEQQNRLRARRFYHPKRKFNRMGPYAHAPRNTTSYIIRAKKSGGIASLVSPCPVTPAVLPTPSFSPSREALVDMAKEEWGVDGYGSMKGLIRLRSPGHDEAVDEYDDEEEGGSSESDVEEHVEVERRLDHDLSRFEMIYPNSGDYHNVLENRVDDQDTHIAQLEEENLILKERLYLMERELGELRRRLLCLERQHQVVEDINEEVVENVSENDSEGLRSMPLLGNKLNEEVDYVPRNGAGESGARRDDSEDMLHKELSELAVKELSHGETAENYRKDVAIDEDKEDTGIVREGVEFDLTVNNKGENHDEEQVQGQGERQKELHELGDNKEVTSAVETQVGSVDDGLKSQSVRDVCMGEVVTEHVNEDNQSEGVNEETKISLKHAAVIIAGSQVEGNTGAMNDEAAGDVSMGDALPMDKGVQQ